MPGCQSVEGSGRIWWPRLHPRPALVYHWGCDRRAKKTRTYQGGIKLTTTTYRADSRQLLAQARDELAQGDTRQASEKGWGAAAQMIKAVAEQHGWDHKHHNKLRETANRLRQETGNPAIRALFDVANSMHTNFYEDVDGADLASERLDDVER